MRRKQARMLFHLSLATGTGAVVVGGLLVVGSLAPFRFAEALGSTARMVGTILLQAGIAVELAAVALHERLHAHPLWRFGATTLQANPPSRGR